MTPRPDKPSRGMSIRPVVIGLFILLTVPVLVTIVAVNYISNEENARDNSRQLLGRFNDEAVNNVNQLFNPIKSLVRSAAALGDVQPQFYRSRDSIRYLASILPHNEKIVSAYVGLNDGSFRQARRIDPQVEIQGREPPGAARTADRWIDRPSAEDPIDHYLFRDRDGRVVGQSEKPTPYDPRGRLWYRTAQETDGISVSDVDVFYALGLVGFTVAASFGDDEAMQGVAAVDITLDGLSDYLAESKISAGTLSYILTSRGNVIANSQREKTYANEGGVVELLHVTSLGNALPAIAYSLRPRDEAEMYGFVHDGREYVASLAALPPSVGKRWQLFVVTPLDDFTRIAQEHNRQLILFGLIAIAVQLLVIYYLSGIIAAPLEKLAVNVGRIQRLDGTRLEPLRSPVREIALLSRAIETLDSAVKSFAAFVPVSLVRQLLETDQKLELGGSSRFLTVFFSDIEGFSSLSEEVPSKELLQRVSTYLETVTRAVNAERGTIDKFMGDGVMAFWGAPVLLEDHAMRACLAALKIKREMSDRNARWKDNNMKPLRIRIGIHSDAVLVGNIGSEERMSYTVLGDGVNIAGRLEGVNKQYGTQLCISQTVVKEAGERLCTRPIDDVVVKGRRAKISIFELLGAYGMGAEFEPDERTLLLCKMTRSAYAALVVEDLELALQRYEALQAEFPDDPVAASMLQTLRQTDAAPTPPNSMPD